MSCLNFFIEFIKAQRLNIFIFIAIISSLSINYFLYQHIKSLQNHIAAHQTHINTLRLWNHLVDDNINALKKQCIID